MQAAGAPSSPITADGPEAAAAAGVSRAAAPSWLTHALDRLAGWHDTHAASRDPVSAQGAHSPLPGSVNEEAPSPPPPALDQPQGPQGANAGLLSGEAKAELSCPGVCTRQQGGHHRSSMRWGHPQGRGGHEGLSLLPPPAPCCH